MFDCFIREERDATLLSPSGELDLASIAAFRNALRNSRKANRHVIIDMGQLQYIDSGAIRLLFLYGDIMRQSRKWFALANVPSDVKKVLKIPGVKNALAIFSSTQDALQSINTNELSG